MQVLIYYPGFKNTGNPYAGTNRMVFEIAKIIAEKWSVIICSELIEYSENKDGITLFPLSKQFDNQVIVDSDVVIFVCGHIGRMFKPKGQKWVRMQHCWELCISECSNTFEFITGVSSLHVNHLRDIGAPAHKLICVNNFIDIKKFYYEGHCREENTIMYAGSIVKSKGLHLLIETVKSLSKARVPVKLEIYGSAEMTQSPKEYEEIVRRSASGLNIEFYGECNEHALRKAYSKNSILCLPSDMESFGLVLAEAQACGCIPVVHDSGGVSAVVEHEKTGFLYRPNSLDVLYELLFRLLKTGISKNMRDRAMENVRKKYTDEKARKGLALLMEGIVK
jgi:glycosyltransferase involved in cell wall biosynthesis